MAIGADRLDLEQLAGVASVKTVGFVGDASEESDLGIGDGLLERAAPGRLRIIEERGSDVATAGCGGLVPVADELVVEIDGIVGRSRQDLVNPGGSAAPAGRIQLALG